MLSGTTSAPERCHPALSTIMIAFALALPAVVLPAEGDVRVRDLDQPGVGDRDPMRIAAEIGQHLFGASERWLGVDHPVEALEFAQATREGLRFGKIGEIGEEP